MEIDVKVNWFNEELEGDNNGLVHGIYTYDVPEEQLHDDDMFADVPISSVSWFKTEKERDMNYIKYYPFEKKVVRIGKQLFILINSEPIISAIGNNYYSLCSLNKKGMPSLLDSGALMEDMFEERLIKPTNLTFKFNSCGYKDGFWWMNF